MFIALKVEVDKGGPGFSHSNINLNTKAILICRRNYNDNGREKKGANQS